MINVLHLTSSFGLSGGAETNLLRLVCHMEKSRFRNTVVTMTELIPQRVPGLLQSRLAEAKVPVYSLGMRRGMPNPLAAARLFRIVRKVRPHVLQTWMYHADLLGLLVGKLAACPIDSVEYTLLVHGDGALPANVGVGTARAGAAVRASRMSSSRILTVASRFTKNLGIRREDGCTSPTRWISMNFAQTEARRPRSAVNSGFVRTLADRSDSSLSPDERPCQLYRRRRLCWQRRIRLCILCLPGYGSTLTTAK